MTEVFDDSLDDQGLIYGHALLDVGKSAVIETVPLAAQAKAHLASRLRASGCDVQRGWVGVVAGEPIRHGEHDKPAV